MTKNIKFDLTAAARTFRDTVQTELDKLLLNAAVEGNLDVDIFERDKLS
jgi:hypothetical protein